MPIRESVDLSGGLAQILRVLLHLRLLGGTGSQALRTPAQLPSTSDKDSQGAACSPKEDYVLCQARLLSASNQQ